MRRRPLLTRLLVVLLLMQWGTAFGHCLRLAAPAADFTVEICTSDGVHRVAMPVGDGEQPAGHAAAAICPACQGPGAFALAAPEPLLAPAVVLAQTVDPPPPPAPPLPLPPRSCQPRAPPTS